MSSSHLVSKHIFNHTNDQATGACELWLFKYSIGSTYHYRHLTYNQSCVFPTCCYPHISLSPVAHYIYHSKWKAIFPCCSYRYIFHNLEIYFQMNEHKINRKTFYNFFSHQLNCYQSNLLIEKNKKKKYV